MVGAVESQAIVSEEAVHWKHPSSKHILGKDMGPGEQGVQGLEAGWAAGAQARSKNEMGAGSQGGQVRSPSLP